MRHRLALTLLSLGFGAYGVDVRIEPWHLHEAGDVGNGEPLIVHTGTGNIFREERKKVSDGSLFESTARKYDYTRTPVRRRQPRPDKLPNLPQEDPKTQFGANRPPAIDPDSLPTPPPLTVAWYYYPWYNKDFHGRKYIRGELIPPQFPVLGEYNDRDPAVIAQHIAWSRQANVNLWVTSWWGPGSGTDTTTKDVILNHPDLTGIKLCLFYETMGRIDVDELDTSKVYDDMSYAAQTYFRHPNYYKIGDRPVVFVYLTRVLARLGILEEVIAMMRTAAFQRGHSLYIVGDHTFGDAPDDHVEALDWLDAITNYDIFGDMGRPYGHAKLTRVDEYAAEQARWRDSAHSQGCAYIPGATPGYNDKAVREADYNAMSRKLDKGLPYGTLFEALLRKAKTLVDKSTGNVLVVNSFNEWHEDTQIEPVVNGGLTTQPWYLTRGYVYQGYGERYLNILHEETSS